MDSAATTISRRETELQKLLTDERTRAEQHKINYQLLKAEHRRLQEEFDSLQTKLIEATRERQQEKECNRSLMNDVERELLEAKSAIKQLQNQVLSPNRVEISEDEIQKHYAEIIKRAEDEAAKYRDEYCALVYKMTALQTESEHMIIGLQRTISESRLQNEIEVSQLRKRCEKAERRVGEQDRRKTEMCRALEKENVVLKQQVEGLGVELRDAQQKSTQQCDLFEEHKRECNKKLSMCHAQLRSSEVEKSSLKEELQRLENSLKLSYEEQSKLRLELSESKANVNRLQLCVSDLEQTMKIDTLDQRDELQREKDEWENKCEHLSHLVKELKLELEDAEKQKLKRDEKEEQKIQELHSAQLQENVTINQLNMKRLELEHQLKKSRRELSKSEDNQSSLKRELSELSRALEEKRISVEKWTNQHLITQQELEALRSSVRLMGEAEKRLLDKNKDLNAALRKLTRRFKDKSTSVGHKSLSRLKRKNKRLIHKLSRTTTASKHKIKKYSHLIVKLRNKLDIQNTQLQQLTIEKESLKCGVPHEIHEIVKKKLHSLQRRNAEFSQALHLYEGKVRSPKVWLAAEKDLYQSVFDQKAN